jgi:TolB-like protein/Flp pilus assembly protein TadD
MIFEFDQFELDIRRNEFRRDQVRLPLEPRSFALLYLLVENHDRLVTREEIIEKAWDGRIVSDTAISTVIKTVRKALGDDGVSQRYIRTIRGRGFRFVARVRIRPHKDPHEISVESTPAHDAALAPTEKPHRPSIAILPFGLVGFSETYSAIADAIPAELISSLSRLRWLWIVARGSTFRFRDRETDIDAIRQSLGADYCISGIVEIFGKRIAVAVELVDTRSNRVIWSERFPSTIDDIHDTRTSIVHHVIAALELHIPLYEANKARLNSPEDMNAWSEYHIGLQHMYRFNSVDNEAAAKHFERATILDPAFARAYAARSFTSFQNAFLKYSPDIDREKNNARRYAEKSIELDPVDPFGNFNLARTCWLDGDPDSGLEMLDRAVQLNPNFAQGFYARAWTDVMACRGAESRASIDTAIALSPLDPFLYAMQSTLGLTYLLQGDFEKAATWAEKGARAPGAHFLIGAIAVAAHQMNANSEMAAYWAKNVRNRRADVSVEHFFTAFPFRDEKFRLGIEDALKKWGF